MQVDFVNKNKRATHASGLECECRGKGEESRSLEYSVVGAQVLHWKTLTWGGTFVMWEYFCHGDTCPLSSMVASLPLPYVWQSSKSTLDTMTYQTRVVILHLSRKETVMFLIAASALAMLI